MATDKAANRKDKKVAKPRPADGKPSTSAPPSQDPASKKRKKDVQEAAEVIEEVKNVEKRQKRRSAVEFFGDDEEQASKKATGTVVEAAKQKRKVDDKPAKEHKSTKEAASEPKSKEVKKSGKITAPDSAASTEPKPSKKTPKKDSKPTLISSVKSSAKTLSKKINEPKGKSSKKSKQKERSPTPELAHSEEEVPSDDEKDEASIAEDDNDEEAAELHGFSTDEDDSSDEEMDFDAAPLDVGKLPTIAKDDAVVKKRLEKAKAMPNGERGVISVSRLPHGFYEDQLKAYFSQFGDVTRLRISRNKKTGKSKHYGFVEFDSASVAQIVAETMDNYLMMGHLLQCKVVPKDQIHPELWVGANRKWRAVPHDRLTRQQHNKPRTDEEKAKAAKRLMKRQNVQKRKIAAAGIEYDFAPVSYQSVKA